MNKFQQIINHKYHNEILEFKLKRINSRTFKLCSIAIQPQHRSKNFGSAILDDLTSYATLNNQNIRLVVAYSTRETLKKYYSRFGFNVNRDETMIYYPKKKMIDTKSKPCII